MGAPLTLQRLAMRAATLAECAHGERPVIGITGAPGAGKSTLAEHLARALSDLGVQHARVPMDGFHLADVELRRLGRLDQKGAIDTFDVDGYAALLSRARTDRNHVVYAPDFDRTVEQPIAGSIPVLPSARVLVTEGNYLLSPATAWRAVKAQIDEIWYCDLPAATRTTRLVARHVRFGKEPADAKSWVRTVDQPNADQVELWASEADLVVDMTLLGLPSGRD